MLNNTLKFTVHTEERDYHAYLQKPPEFFAELRTEVERILNGKCSIMNEEVKCYWIDGDGDKIGIYCQYDYDIFCVKEVERLHIYFQIEKIVPEPDEGSTLHHKVECDVCGIVPILGFRYKCMQCEDYDLCARCEMNHKHSHHIMIRLPNNESKNILEQVFKFNTGGRRSKRCHKSRLPAEDIFNDCGEPNLSSAFHGRRRDRRPMRHGVFDYIYDIMNTLGTGESNVEKATAATENAASSAQKTNSCPFKGYDRVPTSLSNNEKAEKAANMVAGLTVEQNSRKASEEIKFDDNSDIAKQVHEMAINAAKCATMNAAQAMNFANVAQAYSTKSSEVLNPTSKTTREENMNETPNVKETTQARPTGLLFEDPEMEDTNENKKEKPHNEQFNSLMNSPMAEQMLKLIGPEQIRNGLQILSNFNEMFAKMTDSQTDSLSGQSEETSKKPTTLTNRDAAESSQQSSLNESQTSTKKDNDELLKKKSIVTIEDINPNPVMQNISEERPSTSRAARSCSKSLTPNNSLISEDDFEILENEPSIALNASDKNEKIMDPTLIESDTSVKVDFEPAKPKLNFEPAKPVMDFEQLGRNLREHMREEAAQAEEEMKKKKPSETPIIYHEDAVINSAVVAMMSMGFSNEGAWLTQLLESVNGNIPQACELLSHAQNK